MENWTPTAWWSSAANVGVAVSFAILSVVTATLCHRRNKSPAINHFFWCLIAFFAACSIGNLLDATLNDNSTLHAVSETIHIVASLPLLYYFLRYWHVASKLPAISDALRAASNEEELLQVNHELMINRSRLEDLLRHSPNFIFLKSTDDWRYLMVNPAFLADWELPESDVIGKTDYDLFPAKAAAQVREHDEQVLRSGRSVTEEICLPDRDGCPRTYLTVKYLVRNGGPRPYAICGIATDITDRKHAERMLQETNDELREQVDVLEKIAVTQARSAVDGAQADLDTVIANLKQLAQ